MTADSWRPTATRWLKFNLVGGMGIAVQLFVLAALRSKLHFNYLIATALAVETAVIHNFWWHERFTWADRSGAGFARFLKFNLTTGLFSIAGNLGLMKLFVDFAHMNYLVANGITITVCSLLNFLVSDGFVFAAEQTKVSPCDWATGAPVTRYLPASARRDRHAPSNRIFGT